MQRQMNRTETYFNKSVEGMHRLLSESKKKLTDMRASRSAFSVALNNDSALTCFGPFNEDRLIVYKHVFLNLGGGYMVSTGVFTAPLSGVYSFALTIYGKAPNNNTLAVCASLRVNGTVVTGPTEKGMYDREDSATTVVAVKLKAGDEVDVVLPAGCFVCDNSSHFNTFTGFLLYATDHKHHTAVA
ncbi:complement C1q-like protein 4 [Acanthochromis polyacanthus]|uniref:complement C1q-like protein 4 n=1 Tax=Acanthochromis polyacanthus TaxID=80966 RepID=UPI0022345001|nr:complement C1q-like protein 4 [Acanthochromis polyacanthus]